MITMMAGHLLHNVPDANAKEIFESLLISPTLKIERIISKGQRSEPGFWYDQAENEWVLVVKGEAHLRFFDDTVLHLTEGMYVNIPAHVKHRIDWTSPDQETIWLALFY